MSGRCGSRKSFPRGTLKRERACFGAIFLALKTDTVPGIETLEKIARALDVPLYQLFYEDNEKPSPPVFLKPKSELVWGSSGKEARMLGLFRRCLSRLDDNDLELLLHLARKMARRSAVR